MWVENETHFNFFKTKVVMLELVTVKNVIAGRMHALVTTLCDTGVPGYTLSAWPHGGLGRRGGITHAPCVQDLDGASGRGQHKVRS